MSTIRKTPYIETALSLLTDTDKSDLLAIVNSATPVTTQASFNSLVEGINAVIFTFKDGTIKTGILINTTDLQLLIGYHTSEQALELIKLDSTNDTWEIVDEYCDINELRRVIKSLTDVRGIELVDTLPEATEEEYNKHKLYLYNGNLFYIDLKLVGSPIITTLSEKLPNFSNDNIKVVQDDKYAYFVDFSQSADIYRFDPISLTYTTIMTISNSIKNALGQLPNIALVGNCIYCIGTYGTNNAYKFDLFTQETTTYSGAGVGANRTSIGVYGTDIYIIGGYNENTKIRKFDTISNTLTTLSVVMPSDTRAAGTVVVGSKMYMFGTQDESSNIYIFDMANQTVTTSNASIPYTYGGGGAFFVHGSKIDIVWGTSVNSQYSNTYILQYDIENDTCVDTNYTLPSSKNTYLYTYAQFGIVMYIFAMTSTKAITTYTYNVSYFYKKITSTDVN